MQEQPLFYVFSAAPMDILWGITTEGQLVRRVTRCIVRSKYDPSDTDVPRRQPRMKSISSDDGWELV